MSKQSFHIPRNFKVGIKILNEVYPWANFFQGAILASVPALLWIYFHPSWSYTTVIIYFMFACGGLFFLGLNGINNDTFFGYFLTWFKFRKHRRLTNYNPRVKAEIKPFYESKKQNSAVEKLKEIYEKYKQQLDLKQHEANFNVDKNARVYFEDDEGYLEKPIEYMSDKELKAIKKQNKKAERAARKERYAKKKKQKA